MNDCDRDLIHDDDSKSGFCYNKYKEQFDKYNEHRKQQHKPVREDSFPSELIFAKTDFAFVDKIVDPGRKKRSGPKGYRPSSLFMALLLMYLQSMDSILDLVRFLNTHNHWLVMLDLNRTVHGETKYKVPDRSTFYKLAGRVGQEKMLEIFVQVVIQLINLGIIKGEKVSLDCSIIWAWFKDCKWSNNPGHNKKECRRENSRDRDASWTWDHHKSKYVYGYKVHVVTDSKSGLPVMFTITKAGYGENRTVPWFIRTVLLNLPIIKIRKFLADAAYDGNKTRLQIVKKLKALPFIPFNTRRCKGSTPEEKRTRRKVLCYRFYTRKSIKNYWVDPNSEEFDKEFDARTLSEQGFSIGKGSLNLDSLKHRGIEWATLHSMCICMVMLLVAKTAIEIGRPDLTRSVKCFQC